MSVGRVLVKLEPKVGSVSPPRPGDGSFSSAGRWLQSRVKLQVVSSCSPPRRSRVVNVDHVCTHYQSEDQLVCWVSSHSFYLKQMTWSVETVTNYWRDTIRRHRGRYPHAIPTHIRFCISWLSDIDCTNWSTKQVCVWLNHRLSRDHKFETLMYMDWIHSRDPCPLVSTALVTTKHTHTHCCWPGAPAASQVRFACGNHRKRHRYFWGPRICCCWALWCRDQ